MVNVKAGDQTGFEGDILLENASGFAAGLSPLPVSSVLENVLPQATNPQRGAFCGADEFLLFVDQYDCQFTHEAELRPMSLDDAVSECEDTTLQIIRMDQSNWRGEDVTEEVADEWLTIHEPEPDAESTLPDFIADSDAWQDYLDDYDTLFSAPDEPPLDDFELGVGRYG